MKTEGAVHERAAAIACRLRIAAVAAFLLITLLTWQVRPELLQGLASSGGKHMKAIRVYGSRGSETVSLDEIPMPKLGAGEVLVRVHATAVTQGELEWYPTWHTPKGDPRLNAVPSHEFSGAIEEAASDVKGLEKGDAVYGMNNWFIDGAAAEYCITTPAEIAPKPNTIDHLQAAVVPISGLTAWQALFDHGRLNAGQKVLIHGGAGGVGSFAIQLAAWKRALVWTTVSETNVEFVRELGASGIIDYRKTKFEEVVKDADVVLDLVGGDTLRRSFGAIKEGGRVVTIAASSESTEDPKVKEAFFIVEANRQQLVELAQLIDAGIIRPIVGEVLRLEAAAQAYFSTKKTNPGKTVLRVSG
jgi:NADPH:quinone reductase-like Zn-dependent oxidoreductase